MTAPARRRSRAAPATQAAPVAQAVPNMSRLVIEYVDLNDITPYPFNARDNEKAIPSVAASIRSFGFLIPCVIDENNILVAGHTRTEAAKLLGLTEVPCVRARGLTQEQIHQFRLIDNKVSEIAKWDYDLLAGEIAKLTDTGIDWTEFGWSQTEIDCLSEAVAADCLDAAAVVEVSTTEVERQQASARRAPLQARFVLGELVFFTSSTAYRNWANGVRELHNFNEDAIAADLKQRLGILE